MCSHNNDRGIGSTTLYGWRGEVYKVKGGREVEWGSKEKGARIEGARREGKEGGGEEREGVVRVGGG